MSVSPSKSKRTDRTALWVGRCIFCLGLVGAPYPTAAQQSAWSFLDVDCGLRVLATSALPATNHSPAAEQFQLTAGMGSQAFAVRPVTAAPVISELAVRLPIRSNKAGLQMYVRVVLPRTNQADGAPVTILIPGPKYSAVSEWETLQLTDLPRALERQIRVLRSSGATILDAREAFVDLVVVNVYGGKGRSQLALATPEVNGATIRRTATETELADVANPSEHQPHTIRISGAVITIDGRPFAPRIIRPRGESWEFLKELGFNSVWLSSPPTAAQVAKAAALDLWIVAPPPSLAHPSTRNSALFRRVVAWDLAGAGSSVAAQAHLADQLRNHFGRHCRPLVCSPDLPTSDASRFAEALVHQRAVLGTTTTISAYRDWLQRQIDGSVPGTIHWASITTENPPGLLAQIVGQASALPTAHISSADLLAAEPAEVHHLVTTALATGVRGIVVHDSARLDQPDSSTRLRAATLASLNHQLRVMEPWIAGSHLVRWQATDDPTTQLGVFELKRGTLALPLSLNSRAPRRARADTAQEIKLTVAEPSDDAEVYLLRSTGLERVDSERVAGGVRWQAAELHRPFAILVTSDDRMAQDVATQLRRTSRQAIKFKHQIAQLLLDETDSVATACADQFVRMAPSADLELAREAHRKSSNAIQTRKLCLAEQWDTTCLTALRRWRRATSETVVGSQSPAACPLSSSFRTLPWYASWQRIYPPAARGVNLLSGGDFDSLDALHKLGWTFGAGAQLSDDTITLAPRARQGKCLRLATEQQPAAERDEPLVWVTSPPIVVAAGKTVRIDGWLRYQPKEHNAGLCATVSDSWTKTTLAKRITTASDWHPFTIYRVGTGQPLTITCALHAAGELLIDDFQVSPLSADVRQRLAKQESY